MPFTKINTDYVSGQSYLAVNGMATLQSCAGTAGSLGLYYKVPGRYSIGSRLSALQSSLGNLDGKLAQIHQVVSSAAQLYSQVDQSLKSYYQTGRLQSVFAGGGSGASAATVGALTGSASSVWGDMYGFLDGAKPVFSDIKDARKALNQLLKITGAAGSGLRIVQKGNYYIIKGTRDMADRANVFRLSAKGDTPRGTRYRIGSEKFLASGLDRYVPEGSSLRTIASGWKNNLGTALRAELAGDVNVPRGQFFSTSVKNLGKKAFSLNQSGALNKAGAAFNIAGIALDAGMELTSGLANGESAAKITGDVTASVVVGAGKAVFTTACTQVGAAIGTAIPVPVVGTVVGAVAGYAVGVIGGEVYDFVTKDLQICGKSATEWISTGVETAANAVGTAVGTVGKAVGDGLDQAAEAVGDFFGGASKLFGFA